MHLGEESEKNREKQRKCFSVLKIAQHKISCLFCGEMPLSEGILLLSVWIEPTPKVGVGGVIRGAATYFGQKLCYNETDIPLTCSRMSQQLITLLSYTCKQLQDHLN